MGEICSCVHCNVDAALVEVVCDQREVAQLLGGPVGFVGAIPELDVVIVGRRDVEDLAPNRACVTHSHFFHEPAHGPLMLVGSDSEGAPIDVMLEDVKRVWSSTERPGARPSSPIATGEQQARDPEGGRPT